ncbi:MAG: radical SAM protein [Myxococcota bacterium]
MLGGLSPKVRNAYARAGMLWEVHLDLLYQCDLDCEHCYLDDKSTRVLPTSFWRGVIDQMADMQVFTIHMSGGELFLRPDAFELIAHARARGLYVHVKTHGGRLDDAGAQRLVALGVSSVQISYYSHRPDVHDTITRRPGSHVATLATLTALARAGANVIAACVAMDRNQADLAATQAQMHALGIAFRVGGTVRVAQSGADFPRGTAPSAEALVDIAAFRDGPLDPCAPESDSAEQGDRTICGAGHLSLYVDPEGQVTPCVTWPQPIGDLTRGETLAEIWQRSPALARIRALRQRDLATCMTCEHRAICDICPGQGWLETGDPQTPARAVCESTFAKARARARHAGLPEPTPPPPLRGARFRILSAVEAEAARTATIASPPALP